MDAPESIGQPLRGSGHASHSQISQPPTTIPLSTPSIPDMPPAPDTTFFITLLKACDTPAWPALPPLPSHMHPYFTHISLFWSIMSERCVQLYQNSLATRKWWGFIKAFQMLQANLEVWVNAGRMASIAWFASVKAFPSRPRPPSAVVRSLPSSEGSPNVSTDSVNRKRKASQEDDQRGSSANPIVLEDDESTPKSPSNSYPSPTSPDHDERPRKMTKGNQGKALLPQSDNVRFLVPFLPILRLV